MNITKISFTAFLITLFAFYSSTVFAVSFFEDDDEDIIWKAGFNHYIKYAGQDSNSYGINDHPIDLDEKDISNALSSLIFTKKGFFSSEEDLPVFSYSQIKLLSEQLSKSLKSAKPEQDIIFVLGGKGKKLIFLTKKSFVSGRAFFKDGKLNIILGEYNLERNEAFEKLLDSSGKGEVNYSFNFGQRSRQSNKFKGAIIGVNGVQQKNVKNELRKDWLVIDVKLASDAYIADKIKKETPITNAEKELQRQSAQIAKQRREMRAEMARMRKQMEQGSSSSSGGASAKSIEERIATLDQLLKKELITQEEYNSKRKEILDDI